MKNDKFEKHLRRIGFKKSGTTKWPDMGFSYVFPVYERGNIRIEFSPGWVGILDRETKHQYAAHSTGGWDLEFPNIDEVLGKIESGELQAKAPEPPAWLNNPPKSGPLPPEFSGETKPGNYWEDTILFVPEKP